jgi:hypothetical protein
VKDNFLGGTTFTEIRAGRVKGPPGLVGAIGTWGLSPFRDVRTVRRETAGA